MSEGIDASPEDVTQHVTNLWGMTFREIALDVGRDPGRSNVTAARLVTDMRLAEETRRMADETGRLRRWTCVAALAAITAAATAIGIAVLDDDSSEGAQPASGLTLPA